MAIGRITRPPILSLFNENNDMTKMFMKKLCKKTVRFSNYDALKITIFLIKRVGWLVVLGLAAL